MTIEKEVIVFSPGVYNFNNLKIFKKKPNNEEESFANFNFSEQTIVIVEEDNR